MYNISTLQYYEKYYPYITELQEIHLQFGIKYFLYQRIFRNYNFLVLGNTPISYVKYFLQNMQKPSRFVIDCLTKKSCDQFSYSTLIDYKLTPLKMKDCLIRHGIGDSFYISIDHDEYLEGFCFGLDINSRFNGDYLYKHVDNLKEFIKLFKILHFEGINNTPVSVLGKYLPFVIGRDNHRLNLFSNYNKSRLNPFSHREAQLINLIHQNLCNKEIANKLGLSIRTIESYIENIKHKTGYSRNNIKKILW